MSVGGDDDYINCPFNKSEYENFIEELVNAEGAVVHDFDVYEGCMPIEKLAKRGLDAPRFGPMSLSAWLTLIQVIGLGRAFS